jgi:hypothetical protein
MFANGLPAISLISKISLPVPPGPCNSSVELFNPGLALMIAATGVGPNTVVEPLSIIVGVLAVSNILNILPVLVIVLLLLVAVIEPAFNVTVSPEALPIVVLPVMLIAPVTVNVLPLNCRLASALACP